MTTTWYCSHDPAHPAVEAEFNPLFCEALVAARMQCGAAMTTTAPEGRDRPASQHPSTTPPTEREGTKNTVSNLIQMSSGAPEIANGNYVVTLTKFEGPREVEMPDGEIITLYDWTFATEDGQVIEESSSNKTGPKSKMRKWIAALIGRVPQRDESFDPEKDLVGRQCVATIEENERGWPKITNMGVLMQAAPQAPAPQPAPTPAAPQVQEVPELPLG